MHLQRVRNLPRRIRVLLIGVVAAAGILLLFFARRVPIGPNYHDFADKRTVFGISNASDVLSNIPFVLVGIWALIWLSGKRGYAAFSDRRERLACLVFFAGVAFTGFGSFWYHMAPSNARLPWDLLPMACSFMSIVAVTVMERIDPKVGFRVFVPLLLLGMGSVGYWYVTKLNGHDDYRFYLFVQYFAPVVLVMLIGLFPPRYSGTPYLVIAFACYVAAKLFEICDYPVYEFGHLVSGHAIKHVIAAISCFWILRMLQVRHPLDAERASPMTESSCDEKTLTLAR